MSIIQTDGDPIIIAGPCSAETQEQVLETAKAISKIDKVKIFRAGVWKPRTRPGSFEGVGSPALQWLAEAKQATGLPIAIEVAKANHVDEALKAGIDVLWIGARTTVNPFSVQEIADALAGVQIPVMVKNPVTPDLQLWLGAIERLSAVGVKEILAVHRGFSSFQKGKYRNPPQWELALEFRRLMPQIPMINDPSHICGQTRSIYQTAQTALDLDMAGLMIETHIHPRQAWSDARQQLTPQELEHLLSKLIPKYRVPNDMAFLAKLEALREKIDEIDEHLLELLSKRMELVRQIGHYKRDSLATVFQIDRWSEMVEHRLKMGLAMGLPEDTVKRLLDLIHIESIKMQENVLHTKPVKKA